MRLNRRASAALIAFLLLAVSGAAFQNCGSMSSNLMGSASSAKREQLQTGTDGGNDMVAILPTPIVNPSVPDISPTPAPSSTPDTSCFKWAGESALQAAVTAHACVEVQAGMFELEAPVIMPSQHKIRGKGAALTTIKAVASKWQFHGGDSLIASVDSVGVVVSDMTLNGAGIATYAVAARGMTVENTVMTDTRCSGVGIAGAGMIVRNNTIKNSAHTTAISGRGSINCASGGGGVAEGAAIYAEGKADSYNPIITGNTITDTVGPALDVNGVWGGTFSNNKVSGNSAWAGVSLYGASNWTVEGNTITHPAGEPPQPYHPYCAGGPGGKGGSAAIILCQDTDENNLVAMNNRILNNRLSSHFGILSVGAKAVKPYLVPRNNTFTGNDVTGSVVGCASNFSPGQWLTDADVWSNNNCKGAANTGPDFF